jgi:hypothetical protein
VLPHTLLFGQQVTAEVNWFKHVVPDGQHDTQMRDWSEQGSRQVLMLEAVCGPKQHVPPAQATVAPAEQAWHVVSARARRGCTSSTAVAASVAPTSCRALRRGIGLASAAVSRSNRAEVESRGASTSSSSRSALPRSHSHRGADTSTPTTRSLAPPRRHGQTRTSLPTTVDRRLRR